MRALVAACASALFLAAPANAASPDSAPPLPAPTGTVIRVSTEATLQAAVANLTSNTTILIAPGTYYLTSTLTIGNRQLTNIALRGDTNRRDDVVLAGPGMTNGNFGTAPYGVWMGSGVDNPLIANLTIRDFYYHPIILNPGVAAPHLYNVRLVDGGEQLLKSNPDATGHGNDGGIVEYSVFEYTTTSRDDYTNGVDVHGGAGWVIRHNLFRNIRAPFGQLAGPAILMWRGSRDTIVDGNTFINCQREIAFGLEAVTPNDHTGGVILNNFIARESWVAGDVAIGVFDSPSTQVLHNSILTSSTYPNAIEYRFADATNIVIANNLADAAIRSRDGATATLVSNSTSATASIFVNPVAGDLHLAAAGAAAIDAGAAISWVSTDWDGEPRPAGAGPDLGADEVTATAVPSPPPPSTSVQLSPTADTYVRGGRFASRNYGRLQQLEVRNDSDASNVRVAYLMFDITSVASVGRATLRVYGSLASRGSAIATEAHAVASTSWAETSITGDSAPAASSSLLSSVTVDDQTGRWYEFDITALVRDAKAGARAAVSVALMAPSATSKSSVAFSSREGANPPQLVIAP